MLVQPSEDEGATSARPSKPQPTPSPPHPKDSGGNQGDQAKEIKHSKAQIKKLKKKAKPVITHHRSWMKSVSLKQRLAGKKSLKTNWMQKESVSKQGRKSAKAEPSVHKDQLFNELADDTLDYMETEDAQDVGRTRDVVNEEKGTADDEVSTKDAISTAQQKVSTDKENVSTDRPNVSTDRPKASNDKEKDSSVSPDEGIVDQTEGRSVTPTTPTTTLTMFGDDETIAQVLLNMSQAKAVSREKEKGVELKDVEETERPRPTSTRSLLTLKPLPKIDPKDKGKKKIEEEDESDTESEGIPEAEKKFKQLARDEEMARKVQEDWEAEEEVKKLAEEEAIKAALSNEYDFIQARMEADRLLALRLQDEEREKFTVEERAKFLHDTIAAQRRRIAKDVKETLRSYQDLSECLNTSSMKFKESTPKKHEVKKVQQSCLGEDCWELYIPDLVPLEDLLLHIETSISAGSNIVVERIDEVPEVRSRHRPRAATQLSIAKWCLNGTDDSIYVEELYGREDEFAYNNSSSSEDEEKQLARMTTNAIPGFYNEKDSTSQFSYVVNLRIPWSNQVKETPKVFIGHSIYKGKAALTVEPRPPEFAPLDSGAFKLTKEGFILLQFAPAAGVRQYDWSRKQVFSLSVTEIGSIISLGARDSCEFFHDPFKGKSDEGRVRKVLKVEPLPDGSGHFFNLSVQNKLINMDESIYIPVTKAEFAILVSAFNFVVPYLLGWHTFVNSIRPEDTTRLNNANSRSGADLEWSR
ncbi:single-stranded DNA-binding protein WHY1, chloroplastic-like protein [Tanacetum coccineum]